MGGLAPAPHARAPPAPFTVTGRDGDGAGDLSEPPRALAPVPALPRRSPSPSEHRIRPPSLGWARTRTPSRTPLPCRSTYSCQTSSTIHSTASTCPRPARTHHGSLPAPAATAACPRHRHRHRHRRAAPGRAPCTGRPPRGCRERLERVAPKTRSERTAPGGRGRGSCPVPAPPRFSAACPGRAPAGVSTRVRAPAAAPLPELPGPAPAPLRLRPCLPPRRRVPDLSTLRATYAEQHQYVGPGGRRGRRFLLGQKKVIA